MQDSKNLRLAPREGFEPSTRRLTGGPRKPQKTLRTPTFSCVLMIPSSCARGIIRCVDTLGFVEIPQRFVEYCGRSFRRSFTSDITSSPSTNHPELRGEGELGQPVGPAAHQSRVDEFQLRVSNPVRRLPREIPLRKAGEPRRRSRGSSATRTRSMTLACARTPLESKAPTASNSSRDAGTSSVRSRSCFSRPRLAMSTSLGLRRQPRWPWTSTGRCFRHFGQ